MNKMSEIFQDKKLLLKKAGAVLGIILTLSAALYIGYEFGTRNPKKVVIENVTNTESSEKLTGDFGVFWEAWDLLKKEHLKGAELTDKKLIYGAVTGLVNSLGDPNTNFLPPEDSKKFEEDVTGNFGGIGAEIGIKNNQLVIIAPLKGNPAEKAGLKAGDKILAIDAKNTDGLDVNEAVKKIRGEIGKEVILTIFREGWEKSQEFKIIRANIEVPTLEWNVIESEGKKLAHLKLFSFNQNAPIVFYKAALMALLGKTDGIILDLRNNPGGFLEVAVNLAGWFMEKGDLVATERFKNSQEIQFRANGSGALRKVPLVILVNQGSASASEILAGALRANHGIKIIGTKTFGKGTVQELRSLSDGSKIKLTIAHWVFADGTTINDTGVKPDVEASLSEEDVKQGKDSQLEKAKEVLLEEIRSKK